MSFSILNNIAGLGAQNALNTNSVNLNKTLLRISTGKRINSGADDAAGLGIADSLRANVSALNQAVRNANDGISVAQIADGALEQVTSLLTRAVSLSEEAATETIDTNGRTALNDELTSIKDEITRIATQTNFNGVSLFTSSGKNMAVYVGDVSVGTSISVSIGALDATHVGGQDLTASGVDLTSKDNAVSTMSALKSSLAGVASQRGTLGANMNRLQSAVSVLQNQAQNTTSAESTIRDANMAEEIANLTKYQILSQSGIAALAQANSSSQSVLSLLR
jgi:flagellin